MVYLLTHLAKLSSKMMLARLLYENTAASLLKRNKLTGPGWKK